MAAAFLCRPYRPVEVPRVVERVKNTNYVYSVPDCLIHKFIDDVVGVMLVSEQVLSSEQHLHFRFFDNLSDFPQPFPWVLIEEAQTRVVRRAAPHLDCVISDVVHSFQNGHHFIRRHPRSNK
jgi:hypothetical protein